MRIVLAFSLGLLGTPLLAQKPTADPDRDRYRDGGIAICVAELNEVEGTTPDSSEAICGCAVGRFMPRWPTGALPPLGEGRIRTVMAGELLACAAREDGALAAPVARHLAAAPTVPSATAPDEGGKPVEVPDEPERPAFDLRAWFDGLWPPQWLTRSGLPVWLLAPLILFVLLFLRGLMRRRDGKDLMGPPRSLDPGTRRPDLPPPRL